MVSHGYKRLVVDQCIFVQNFSNNKVVILLYIDDKLIIGETSYMINILK